MKIAFFSDVHGNSAAMDNLQADLSLESPDLVIFQGDALTLGPDPLGVLEQLRNMGCLCIMGNHDEFMVRPESAKLYTTENIILESIDWCRSLLSESDLQFIRQFSGTFEKSISESFRLFCFHGTPESNTTDLVPSEFSKILLPLENEQTTLFAGGHTHVQVMQRLGKNYVLNPGSAGMPFLNVTPGGPPKISGEVEYAIAEIEPAGIEMRLKRLKPDMKKYRQSLESSKLPLRQFILSQI